jgi:hypothetical protein
MTRRRSTLAAWPLVIFTAVFAAGCEGGFIGDAARDSLASFITSVFSTAVNETITPD